MAAADPLARSLSARIAAATRWAKTEDRTTATAPMRKGMRDRLARQIDPDGRLASAELKRRVDSAVLAHMTRMTLAAKRKRDAAAAAA